MKKNVYCICSINQEEFLIFGTRKRAEDWITNHFSNEIFNKSEKKDLYVVSRIVF